MNTPTTTPEGAKPGTSLDLNVQRQIGRTMMELGAALCALTRGNDDEATITIRDASRMLNQLTDHINERETLGRPLSDGDKGPGLAAGANELRAQARVAEQCGVKGRAAELRAAAGILDGMVKS